MTMIKSICINCGSSSGLLPEYIQMASLLGKVLACQKIKIVYGGASVGLMGAVANSSIENGGEVVGIIPTKIADKVKHNNLTELFIVDTMHKRKQKMFDLSDAFIALPGGFGTLEELFELLTWGQLGYHNKPCGILNVCGYYDLLLNFIDRSIAQKFIKPIHKKTILIDSDVNKLLEKIFTFKPFYEDKWINGNK